MHIPLTQKSCLQNTVLQKYTTALPSVILQHQVAQQHQVVAGTPASPCTKPPLQTDQLWPSANSRSPTIAEALSTMAHPRALHRVAKQGCILTTRTLCPTLPSSSTVPIARCGLLPSPLHAPTAQQQTAAPHHHRMLLHTSAAAADASTPVATAPSMASRATSPAWGALLGFAAAAAATATTIATASEAPAAAQDPYAPPTELHGMPTSLVLYQYEVCPFCCKVKAFLDYYNVCVVFDVWLY